MRSLFAFAALLAAGSAQAADFGFSTLVRLGGAGSEWEVAAGNSSTSLGDYWASGASRQFQIIYDRPANRVQLRVFANNGSSSVALNSTPTGSPPVAGAVWRLPASSFFVTALTGANVWTGVTLSSMTLTGISGALNVIAPLQQTAMQAGSSQWQPSQTVAQSQDVIFQSDATGSWRLSGYVTMNYFGLGGTGHEDRLVFGLSALTSSATPEPSTGVLVAAGAALFLLLRNRV